MLLLAVGLAYLDKVFMALWPGARDDLEAGAGWGGHAGPRASLPPCVGGGRGEQQAQLN